MSTIAVVACVLLVLLLIYLAFMFGAGKLYREQYRTEGRSDTAAPRPGLRRFYGRRHRDSTGISGTGIPVEGVVFSDGWTVTHWLDKPPMNEPKTEVWHNPGTRPFERISGHGGDTEVVWLD